MQRIRTIVIHSESGGASEKFRVYRGGKLVQFLREVFADWSRGELFGASTLLLAVGAAIDRLLLVVYEWWKRVKCFGEVIQVRVFTGRVNAHGMPMTLEVFDTDTKETRNYLTDQYDRDSASVEVHFGIRFFNSKKVNIGLQEIRVVLLNRQWKIFTATIADSVVNDLKANQAGGRARVAGKVGTLTLLPRVWNELSCATDRIPISEYLGSEELWLYAIDENERRWCWKIDNAPAIQKR